MMPTLSSQAAIAENSGALEEAGAVVVTGLPKLAGRESWPQLAVFGRTRHGSGAD